MRDGGRIGRFVKAARSLLLLQLTAGVLAIALSVWAFVAVRDLAAQRDQLQSRVAELENQRTMGMPSQPVAPTDGSVMTAAPILIPIPIGEAAGNVQVPVETAPPTPPAGTTAPTEQQPSGQTPTQPNPGQDCSGANADQPRCRPGRWNRPVLTRPIPRVAPEPQRPGNQQQPQIR